MTAAQPLKCEICEFNPTGYYCEKLRHPLEHGYAMRYHAEHCGEKP